jgi:toxin ParE1/3/4
MSLIIEKSPSFHFDVASQFEWYAKRAGDEVAWRFFDAIDMTLLKLARQPDLGRLRHFRHPSLQGLQSVCADRPFDKFLVFYRVSGNKLSTWRLMHGARDLSRRLREPLSE